MLACLQIFSRRRVERQWEKNSHSQFSIDALQLMKIWGGGGGGSNMVWAGCLSTLDYFRAAYISSLRKGLDSVFLSMHAFLLRFSISVFTSLLTFLLELDCWPFSISLLAMVLVFTQQGVGFFIYPMRWVKVCQAFPLEWPKSMDLISVSQHSCHLSSSTFISLSASVICLMSSDL